VSSGIFNDYEQRGIIKPDLAEENEKSHPEEEKDQSPNRRNRREAVRRNPIEEYFSLVTQSVKLNSPYMDTICTISA
jgi:hypothetical protein